MARSIGSNANLKIAGLSGHPCFTPALMGMSGVYSLPQRTEVVLPSYKRRITYIVFSFSPAQRSVRKRERCGMDPKAFVKSSHVTQHWRLERRASVITTCRAKLCSLHPSTGQNHFCAVLKRLFRAAHRPSRSASTDAYSFAMVSLSAIGRQFARFNRSPFLCIKIVEDFLQGVGTCCNR